MRTPMPQLALVVDDEILIAMAIADHCRDLGIQAVEAGSGVEALRLFDRHPGIDVLITDVRMPDMSGPELTDIALRRRPFLAVLFVTGCAGPLARLPDHDRWPVLHKPFDLALLGPALQRALQARRT